MISPTASLVMNVHVKFRGELDNQRKQFSFLLIYTPKFQ